MSVSVTECVSEGQGHEVPEVVEFGAVLMLFLLLYTATIRFVPLYTMSYHFPSRTEHISFSSHPVVSNTSVITVFLAESCHANRGQMAFKLWSL